ncbi:acid phosphatase 1-like [Nymphaea colorata]|nr:acid phosphatase 1-like [Nymphaea colorata]
MAAPALFLFVLITVGFNVCADAGRIRQVVPQAVHPAEDGADSGDGMFCPSWHFAVETNDAGFWATVPSRCVGYVKQYLTGGRYESDSAMVSFKAAEFARGVEIAGDGKDAWVFDIDETLLSNLPYYAANGFGSEAFNEATFDEWADEGIAPALPESLKLYKVLKSLGFELFLLTGRSEPQRNVTVSNLLFAGYDSWNRLILRAKEDQGKPAILYKSERRLEMEKEGYRIHGSSGDQWSDLLGFAIATRSFKLPNPMYYIP